MIEFEINNDGIMTLNQEDFDGEVTVTRRWLNDNELSPFRISAADFITMLNWYRYQKDNNNERLEF